MKTSPHVCLIVVLLAWTAPESGLYLRSVWWF
jgi:hypothetical protein